MPHRKTFLCTSFYHGKVSPHRQPIIGPAPPVISPGGKFHPDGGLALKVEFVASEARENIGFSDARVSHQNDFEQEIVFIILGHHRDEIDLVFNRFQALHSSIRKCMCVFVALRIERDISSVSALIFKLI